MSDLALRDLVAKRIEDAYGGNMSAFARHIGLAVAHVSLIRKGSIVLPEADVRRKLARELGISHVALLVAAGALDPAEVAPVAPMFADGDPRGALVVLARDLPDDDVVVLCQLARFLRGRGRRDGG